MNSNLFHNVANVATLLLAAGTAVLIASGCTQVVNGGLDCSKSFIDPTCTAVAIGGLQVLKLAVNMVRDGISGLTKPQPPVQN